MVLKEKICRYIGISHRAKRSADKNPQYTRMAVQLPGERRLAQIELESEEQELAFVKGETVKGIPGLRSGDVVAMMLGGTGDYFAFALSRRAAEIGAEIWRIPPLHVKSRRDKSRGQDAVLLMRLIQEEPELFYPVLPRDRNLILVRELTRSLMEAVRARVACEQRIYSSLIGSIFCNEAGYYPEGSIEKRFVESKANDAILIALLEEEKRREKDLKKALEELDVYRELFSQIPGCGLRISARLISVIGDIRRFSKPSRLRKYLGAHVDNGNLPRHKKNVQSDWDKDGRLALYLLGDQFNRRPDCKWGQMLLTYKAKFSRLHPQEIRVSLLDDRGRPVLDSRGRPRIVRKYYKGHIHRMATWRTLTRFVDWLFVNWTRYERARSGQEVVDTAARAA